MESILKISCSGGMFKPPCNFKRINKKEFIRTTPYDSSEIYTISNIIKLFCNDIYEIKLNNNVILDKLESIKYINYHSKN